MTILKPDTDWQIVFELADDWEGHEPYWAFSIYKGHEKVGVGSADNLDTIMSMAREMFGDILSGKLWKGVRPRQSRLEVMQPKSPALPEKP